MKHFLRVISTIILIHFTTIIFATPVSREYVDSKFNSIQNYYLYDDSDIYFSTSLVNSVGQLYKIYTEKILGGTWSIDQVKDDDSIITITAPLIEHDIYKFHWNTNNILDVIYNMSSGEINITYNYNGQTKNAIYLTEIGKNPLKNNFINKTSELKYKSGYNFASLKYISQGETIVAKNPYDEFVRSNQYEKDRQNTVTSITLKNDNANNDKINQNQTGNITIHIPDVKSLASTNYVNKSINNNLFVDNPDDNTKYTPKTQSIVGRLKILENTAQKQQQSVVNYIWTDDMTQVLDASAAKYKASFYPIGRWNRTTINNPDNILESFTNTTKTVIENTEKYLFTWKSDKGTVITYNQQTGVITYKNKEIITLDKNINPEYSEEFEQVILEDIGNLLTFTKRSYIINEKTKDPVVFDSMLPTKTVTGLSYPLLNGTYEQYTDGHVVYYTDKICIPNYSLDYLNKFLYNDMYSWSTNQNGTPKYINQSLVGRIWQLENGGEAAIRGFISTPLSQYLIKTLDNDNVKTNDSIVGNLYRIRQDYTTKNMATNIAAKVTSNIVTTTYIKNNNFYDIDEVDKLISEKIEQKRGLYLYDDVKTPKQLVDSRGRLYQYGIEDLGGSYFVSKSTGAKDTLGKYFYAGYNAEIPKYSWTNIYEKIIWYNPTTGVISDPNSTAEGSEESQNLNPLKCEILPDINTTSTTASFTPQESLIDRRYKESYDRFALNSELDTALINTKSTISQLIPTLNIAIDNPGRSFNSFFTINGNNLTPGSTVNSFINLSNGNNIQFPINSLVFDKVDIKFTMQITLPDSDYAKWWEIPFLKSSNTEFLPTILIFTSVYQINKDIKFTYPGNTSLKISDTSLYKSGCNLDVHLILNKVDGSLSFSISNTVNSLNYEYTGFSNVDRKDNETLTLGMNYTDATLLLVSDSLVVTFDDDTIKQLVISEPSEYTKVTKLNAAKELGDTTQINLKLASTTDYGVVKPDGTTIKINDDGLLVTGDVGASEDDMKKILTNTKITDLTSSETNSIVSHINSNISDISSLNESLKTLQESNNEILKQLKEYNEKLDNALNGETN